MTPASRIITNTLATYVKLFVLALTGLFAVPVALRTLGAVDYGIFSVIGGCLTFLTFVNISLQNGAQRHIAYALGEGRKEEATNWFTTSLIIHLVLGLLVGGCAFLASGWTLHHLLTLPSSRIFAAAWIYRMGVLALVCNVISTPYQALLVAHEELASISFFNTLSGIFLFASVFCLKFLPGDALLWYGTIYCVFQISVASGPALYCYYRYSESQFHFLTPDQLRWRSRELIKLSGWTMLLVFSTLVRAQGPAVVLNRFFGPLANAAYGLAVQAQWFASSIIWGFLGATTPSIVKRQASGDYQGMALLSNQSNTYGFAILWMILAPVLFEMEICLKLWLHVPPPGTAAFLSPVLIALLIDQLTLSYNSSLLATGRMAGFSLVISVANTIGVPAGYFLLRAGLAGPWILWAIVMGTVLAGCGRLWFARKHTAISIKNWAGDVLFPVSLSVLASSAVLLILVHVCRDGLGRFAMSAVSNCVIVCLVMWFLGMRVEQRFKVMAFVASIFSRLSGRRAEVGRPGVSGIALSQQDPNTSIPLKITVPDRND
jgi:O-antigen/teichoic acid export membrane protein